MRRSELIRDPEENEMSKMFSSIARKGFRNNFNNEDFTMKGRYGRKKYITVRKFTKEFCPGKN